MNTAYQNLPHQLLSPGTLILHAHDDPEFGSVRLQDAAASVYTDFRHTRPFSIADTATLDDVNARMIACGVRLLFVADGDGRLQGLITYSDVFGEKPVTYIREHGGSRGEILARDVMTPLIRLEALRDEDVARASVGDIVHTIKTAGRQHMLVFRNGNDGGKVICGLFSSTHIEKRVGIKIELSARANTFADLERALN